MRSSATLLFIILLTAGCVEQQPHDPSHSSLHGAHEMVYEPTQCRTNPWQPEGDATAERSAAEAQQIAQYYAKQGVTMHDVRFETKYEAVCDACSCPRGDWIHAHVPAEDAAEARRLGWKAADEASKSSAG